MAPSTTTPLTCRACGHANPPNAETCEASSIALDLERAAQSLADSNAQMQTAIAAPSKGFTTVNGFGTTRLDYRPLAEGLYRTTRQAAAAYIPLVPMGDYVIRPIPPTPGPVRHQYQNGVERREPTEWARVPLA